MMTWPGIDQYVPVSTVANPVTVTEEADVKNAAMKSGDAAPARANGSNNSSVPTTINTKNVIGNNRTGCAMEAGIRRRGGRVTTATLPTRPFGRQHRPVR